MPAKIVVVGSFNADLVMYMPRLPQIGETVSGHRFTTGPGGKGSNQAVAAARLGAAVTFIGRVGRDSFAEVGLKLWEAEGISTRCVVRDPQLNTGIASIFVDDEGENVIALALGANMALSREDLDAVEEVIAQADALITQLEIPPETAAYALQLAKKHNVTTILNPAPAAPLPLQTLSLADYIIPNESELEILCDRRSGSIERDAESLIAMPDQTVIVTMGAWGAIWVRKNAHGHITAFPVEAVDTVGGGDAFNAGLAVAVAEGLPLREALLFANAAAALSVTQKGAAESMPPREEVDKLVRKRLAEEREADE